MGLIPERAIRARHRPKPANPNISLTNLVATLHQILGYQDSTISCHAGNTLKILRLWGFFILYKSSGFLGDVVNIGLKSVYPTDELALHVREC